LDVWNSHKRIIHFIPTQIVRKDEDYVWALRLWICP
jgi:hypothetical protein